MKQPPGNPPGGRRCGGWRPGRGPRRSESEYSSLSHGLGQGARPFECLSFPIFKGESCHHEAQMRPDVESPDRKALDNCESPCGLPGHWCPSPTSGTGRRVLGPWRHEPKSVLSARVGPDALAHGAEGQGASLGLPWVRVLPVPLILHVTQGKSLSFSEPRFSLVQSAGSHCARGRPAQAAPRHNRPGVISGGSPCKSQGNGWDELAGALIVQHSGSPGDCS